MKSKIIAAMIVALFVTGMFFALPVLAKGGSAKGTVVEWAGKKAIFYTTGSGIIHQWRYEPEDKHWIYKPVDKFPEPQGEGWYGPYSYGGSVLALKEIFGTTEYWVHANEQG